MAWRSWATPGGFPLAIHVIPGNRRQGVGRRWSPRDRIGARRDRRPVVAGAGAGRWGGRGVPGSLRLRPDAATALFPGQHRRAGRHRAASGGAAAPARPHARRRPGRALGGGAPAGRQLAGLPRVRRRAVPRAAGLQSARAAERGGRSLAGGDAGRSGGRGHAVADGGRRGGDRRARRVARRGATGPMRCCWTKAWSASRARSRRIPLPLRRGRGGHLELSRGVAARARSRRRGSTTTRSTRPDGGGAAPRR